MGRVADLQSESATRPMARSSLALPGTQQFLDVERAEVIAQLEPRLPRLGVEVQCRADLPGTEILLEAVRPIPRDFNEKTAARIAQQARAGRKCHGRSPGEECIRGGRRVLARIAANRVPQLNGGASWQGGLTAAAPAE